MTEEVLIIPGHIVESIFDRPKFHDESSDVDEVLNAIKCFGRYVEREIAEGDETLKQVIAYSVIRFNNSLLCLKRTKNSDRVVLRERYTFLFGGHVDHSERNSANPLVDCLRRELEEELGIVPVIAHRPLGIVFDPTTSVGRLHLGIVFESRLNTDEIRVGGDLDSAEFTNTGRMHTHRLLGPPDFADRLKSLDPWSFLFSMSKTGREMLNIRRDETRQLSLPFEL